MQSDFFDFGPLAHKEMCEHEFQDIERTYADGSKHIHPTCKKCGKQLQAKAKPGNESKRREGVNNGKHRDYWRAKSPDGCLHCALCDVREDEPSGGLQMHHLVAIQDGGTDNPGDAIPLCTLCHTKQQLDRRRVHAMRGAK